MRGLRLWALGIALACAAPAAAQPAKSQAQSILDRATSNPRDAKAIKQALDDLDQLIVKNPKDADAHAARAALLSMTGKNDEALGEYARAFQLDPLLVTAAYNAGVVAGRTGNLREAALWFERALKVDPKHADAAYNAGQTYYDLKDFKKAAARWELAQRLEPDDFQIAKRLVQTYVAMGNKPQILRARDRLFAMWRSNAENHKQRMYLFDTYPYGKYKVAVYELFEPGPDMPVFEAHVELNDKMIGKVNLEQSKDGFVIAVLDKAGGHTTVQTSLWKKAPDYATFRGAVGKMIDSKFQ